MGEDTNTAGIELPDDLSTVDDRALGTLRDKIAKAFEKINSKDKISATEMAEMAALVDQRDLIATEETSRETAQSEAQVERQRLAQRMSGEGAEEGDGAEAGDGDGAEGDGGEAAGGEGDGTEGAGEGDEGAGDGAEGGEEVGEVPTVEGLAASFGAALVAALKGEGGATRPVVELTQRPTAAQAAAGAADRNRPRERANGMPSGFNIVASSDIQGVSTGSHLDMDGLDEALHRRARSLGVSRTGRGDKAVVASIDKVNPINDVRGLTNKGEIQAAWDKAHDVQDNLVASGGWCGPTENIYDFACDFESMPDEVDLPTLTTARSGVNVPDALLLGDVMGQPGIGEQWTNAMDIDAGDPADPDNPTVKVCFKVPCPDWDETVLEAIYTCVQAGNLADRSFPEGTARTRDLSLLGHAHRLNGAKLTKMEAAAVTAGAVDLTDLSAAEAVLAGVEFVIARSRDVYFMSANQVLEVVLPRWVKDVMRRDLARRAAVDFEQVDDTTIRDFFSQIGARVQFVTNWHPLVIGDVAYPTSVVAMVYPAGAFTLLDGGSLDIAVIRDSVLNKTNDHTLLFFEEFWQLLTRCVAYKVTIPLCARGGTGVAAAITCPTA